MKRGFDWRYAAGAALLLAAAAVVLVTFSLMNRPEREERYLADLPDERNGWEYELLADGQLRPYEVEFGEDGYLPELPEETQAVRITRAMTEEISNAELEWHSYLDGVEVFLGGELLYSDFRDGVARDESGFLRLTDEDWERLHREQGQIWQRVRMSLPADYRGKELSMITYFPEEWGIPTPEYPYLGSDESYIASFLVYSVKYDVVMTIYALLALLTAAMFLLDISNGGADAKTALLCLYFILLFLYEAAISYAGSYSELSRHVDLNLLGELYVAPLYLYLALRLKKRWKYPLCGAVLAWTIYEVIRCCWRQRQGLAGTADRIGPWSLAVFLAVAVASCADLFARGRQGGQRGKRLAAYALAAAIVGVNLFNRFRSWGGARAYLENGIWMALRMGSFEPVMSLATDVVSAMALIAVISNFVRRTLRSRQEMSVLQERERQTMEGYARLLAAESATSALHHEMRHHMTALSGILKSGDIERAARYAEAVAGDLDNLPTGRYSRNLLVDVIAGSFLDRALARRIRVEHQLNLPPELPIADEDLSVFLSNMLQNALEACERMDPDAARFIRVEMRLRGNFLFVKCVNSAPDEPEGEEQKSRPGHGYGLAAMRKVAEKYDSVLLTEHGLGEFMVRSDLCLKSAGAEAAPAQ